MGDPKTSGTVDGFADLVDRTRGPQVGRRLFHAAFGTIMAAFVAWAPLMRRELLLAFASLFLLQLLLDVVRLTSPRVNALFFKSMRVFASPREEAQVASSTWFTLGVLLTVAVYDRGIAASSVLVLAFADPAASYIGRRWGRRAFGTGSVLGTLVFAAVALLVLGVAYPIPVAVAAAVVVALFETLPAGVDDNLVVPLTTGFVLTLLGGAG